MGRVHIRQTSDASRVRGLFDRIGLLSSEWPEITSEHQMWLASSVAGDVGFLISQDVAGDPSSVFVAHCGVADEARGLGLHRRMIERLCSWARSAGKEYVITYVLQDNHVSFANFIRTGFLIYEPEWAYVGREGVTYLMRCL